MEYIDSSKDLVKLKILLLVIMILFVFKANTFTRIHSIIVYFVMVKNIILQFSSANYLNFINNLNCFAKDSVSFMQFTLEHKQFEIIKESFNLKFKNRMISYILLDPFSLSLISIQ